MRKTALRLSSSAVSIPVAELELHARGWLLDGQVRQLSPNTIAARRFLIEKLLWFLRQREYPTCGTAELRASLAYVSTAHESDEGRWGNPRLKRIVRPRTAATYYGNLKTLFRYLVEEEAIEASPLEALRPPVARLDQVQPFTDEQVAALLTAARRSRHPHRDVAIVLMRLDTGARASELCGIRLQDLDFQGKRCVVTGKGNKRRALYFGKDTTKALWAYLKAEPRDPGDFLFLADRGPNAADPLTRSGLLQLIRRLGRAAKIEACRCSPHTFRHTFACSFLKAGGNVFTLKELLGHTTLAMVKLRETGQCFFRLPEEIFDLDYPGHYFRRIKSVSLTLPCVVGPYTTISCTLRMLKNSIRINTASGDNGYPRNTDDQGLPADDDRFIENNIAAKAIAASGAQNDSGVFELTFRDERYLPFEGAGAISEWSLELFSDLPSNNPDPTNPDFGRPLRQFDYASISDAVLHVKYTAREDAGLFKNGAITHLRDQFSQDGATSFVRLFNLRQEFPSQWQRFLYPNDPGDGNVLDLQMSPRLFPFRDVGRTLKVNTIWLLARCTDVGNYTVTLRPPLPAPPPAGSDTVILGPANLYGGLHFRQKDVVGLGISKDPSADPIEKWELKMTRPGGGNLREDPAKRIMEVEDVFLVLGYEWE